jgi:CRISPR-associated endonuclease/helicase Cas3
MSQLLAHSGQSLAAHANGVAQRACQLAKAFDGTADAHLAGLLHDLGKAQDTFQKRIHGGKTKDDEKLKQPHAPHGAALALKNQLWPVAFSIYAHHAGLHNRSDLQHLQEKYLASAEKCLAALRQNVGDDQCEFPELEPELEKHPKFPEWINELPASDASELSTKKCATELYIRMLFSALVDADRLDTEAADNADGAQTNSQKRRTWRLGKEGLAAKNAAAELLQTLLSAIAKRAAAAQAKGASKTLMETRAEVLEKCQEVARSPRGVFTLTVPTGGAKTLASIAFALSHIAHHNANLLNNAQPLRRIIIVIPYTSIIQQTTRELQKVFGDYVENEKNEWIPNPDKTHAPLILEHHSQSADPEIKDLKNNQDDSDGWSRERTRRQLAAENWDAPIVVTTSVQFFDSLFSRRPADARKLHNICQSVLIFDEVQTLPPLLMQPILDVLKELASRQRPYGCSLLLCTATQPALTNASGRTFGFTENEVTHVIPTELAKQHFEKLKRVEYSGLSKEEAPPTMSNEDIVEKMLSANRQQALAILNTRKQARDLFDALLKKAKETGNSDAVFHLSTWMYPAHRLQVLEKVSRRLKDEKPCLLVATQCIEAGVDVDFPLVLRAFGPYDSIVQAAGRCNRNGALKDDTGNPLKGSVIVFSPEDAIHPQGVYASAIENTTLLRKMGKAIPENPETFETYFDLLYQVTVPDVGACEIQLEREKLHFKAVDELFNFIDSDTVPLVIETATMEDGRTVGEWLKEAKAKKYLTAEEWRTIQPFIVNLSFPSSTKTKTFLNKTNSELVFKDDDPVRGLRRMKINILYSDGVNGSGLDVNADAFDNLNGLL